MWHLDRLVFFSCLIVVAASVSARATPFDFRTRSAGHFSVEVQERDDYERDFLKDWAAAHYRWGSGIPKEALGAFSSTENKSQVPVTPVAHDMIYVAKVHIGNPPQLVKMALDTGSSDVWSQSPDTKYSINTNGPWPPRYNPNASTTAHPVDKATWYTHYADGSYAEGIVYRDTVRLGNFEVKNATVQSAAIISPKMEGQTGYSGVMGFAKRLENTTKPPQPTFLSMLRRQLRKPVFAVDLRHNGSSRFDFGRVDATLGSEEMTWVPTNATSPFWTVELNFMDRAGNHKFETIVDTGSSMIFLPEKLTERYWNAATGVKVSQDSRGAYQFPCAAEHMLPDLKFKVPGTEHVLTVPGRYLNFHHIPHTELCWSGLQNSGWLSEESILGIPFLKAVFMGFDMESGRLGFANKDLHDK
ncbi:putative aspartyl protease [Ophiocordyceps camponoti-saundersi (nom. inval.)]|nr:putative aspartyl protease [Ophiocordyceps camponoti-saundersi (nom. inval.)]